MTAKLLLRLTRQTSQILTHQRRQLTGNASYPSTVRNQTMNPGNANVQALALSQRKQE